MVHQVGTLALAGDQSLGPSTQIVAQALHNSSPSDIQFPLLAALGTRHCIQCTSIHASKTLICIKLNSIKF